MKLSPETCLNWPECCCSGECDDDRRRFRGWALYVVIATMAAWAVIFAALWIVLSIDRADAHDAIPTAAQPLGWKYPYLCCSDMDCRQVQSKVKETPQGYVVPSGEVIAMSDTRIKDSPDGEFHWCTVAGEDTSRTICLFVPPRGF